MALKPIGSFYRPHRRLQFDGTCIDYKTGEIITPPYRTEQHHKDACDINLIVKRLKPHEMQQLIERNAQLGMYVDLPDNSDYQSALDTVREAGHAFDSLPSPVRERFNHDPAAFLAFASNPANIDELRKFGLASPALPPSVSASPPPAAPGPQPPLQPNTTSQTPSVPTNQNQTQAPAP